MAGWRSLKQDLKSLSGGKQKGGNTPFCFGGLLKILLSLLSPILFFLSVVNGMMASIAYHTDKIEEAWQFLGISVVLILVYQMIEQYCEEED